MLVKLCIKILQNFTERKPASNLPTSPATLADIVADTGGIWRFIIIQEVL